MSGPRPDAFLKALAKSLIRGEGELALAKVKDLAPRALRARVGRSRVEPVSRVFKELITASEADRKALAKAAQAKPDKGPPRPAFFGLGREQEPTSRTPGGITTRPVVDLIADDWTYFTGARSMMSWLRRLESEAYSTGNDRAVQEIKGIRDQLEQEGGLEHRVSRENFERFIHQVAPTTTVPGSGSDIPIRSRMAAALRKEYAGSNRLRTIAEWKEALAKNPSVDVRELDGLEQRGNLQVSAGSLANMLDNRFNGPHADFTVQAQRWEPLPNPAYEGPFTPTPWTPWSAERRAQALEEAKVKAARDEQSHRDRFANHLAQPGSVLRSGFLRAGQEEYDAMPESVKGVFQRTLLDPSVWAPVIAHGLNGGTIGSAFSEFGVPIGNAYLAAIEALPEYTGRGSLTEERALASDIFTGLFGKAINTGQEIQKVRDPGYLSDEVAYNEGRERLRHEEAQRVAGEQPKHRPLVYPPDTPTPAHYTQQRVRTAPTYEDVPYANLLLQGPRHGQHTHFGPSNYGHLRVERRDPTTLNVIESQADLPQQANVGNVDHVPVAMEPWKDTDAWTRLHAGLALREAVHNNTPNVEWSTATNRRANAKLPSEAARITYDKGLQEGFAKQLNWLGFDMPEVTRVGDATTYHADDTRYRFSLTQPMIDAIRKYGVMALGAGGIAAMGDQR